MKKTALYNQHRALNAKMVDFGGFNMPIQYKGIFIEHNTVRKDVGIFDVSPVSYTHLTLPTNREV